MKRLMYLLNKQYTLETFRYEPFFIVNEDKRFVRMLNKDEFSLLKLCDGSHKTDTLTKNQELIAQSFEKQGILSQVDVPHPDKPLRQLEFEIKDFLHFDIAQIAITGRCNLHCKHCVAATGQQNNVSQLSLDECKKIFADMIDARIFDLWLTGGEPLFHPQFKEIVCAASEYGLRLSRILTNALLVNDELLDFLEEQDQKPQFAVSFDGLGTHDWMRDCKGAEQRTLAAIDLILSRGFDVCASICVNGLTAPRLIETCRYLVYDHGVRNIYLIWTCPTPRGVQFVGEKEQFFIWDHYDLLINLLRVSRTEKGDVAIDAIYFPHVHLLPGTKALEYLRKPPAARHTKRIMSGCNRASSVAFISSDGRVLPCSGYEGGTAAYNIMTGDDVNVKARPLKDIFSESEYADEYRKTLADLKHTDPECLNCKGLQICCGGCPFFLTRIGNTDYVINDVQPEKTIKNTDELKSWYVSKPQCVFFKRGYAKKYLKMLEETS